MRSTMTLFLMLVVVGFCGSTANADYLNPPAWSNDTDFTHQTWEFNTDDVPLVADDGYTNPFGDPTLTEVFLVNPDYMFWMWEPMGPPTERRGVWGGMAGGIGPEDVAVSMTFEVPNSERPEPWHKELWIQVAYYGCIANNGEVIRVEIARDADFQDLYLTYDATADDIEDPGEIPGSSGQYWRFTHTFVLDDQPETEYVRVSLLKGESVAVFFDQISIDTRCTHTLDYVNPPGWDDDTDFTHQAWEFDSNSHPLVADGGYDNSFGAPTMTDVYLANPEYMMWVWESMGGGTRFGHWGGMTFGLDPNAAATALTFEVPNSERPDPWRKELWIQVAYWGGDGYAPEAPPDESWGEVLTVEIARDPDFQDVYLIYEAVADDIEDQSETGSGSSGQFWRFTHAFVLDDQPAVEYVRLSLVPADSMAVFFDHVSIDTHCVIMPVLGDCDSDGDVDLADFLTFQTCFTGPGGPVDPGCECADFDFDDDVDLSDFLAFQTAFTGPGGGP